MNNTDIFSDIFIAFKLNIRYVTLIIHLNKASLQAIREAAKNTHVHSNTVALS